MADTYSQIYIQIVFSTYSRQALIQLCWEEELYKYISGVVRNKKQKLLAVNGTEDHIHLFVGLKPSCRLSDFVREIKKASSQFINQNNFSPYKFQWQEGFGAFSYGHSQVDNVCRYVRNQKEHHRKQTFKEEYVEFLKLFNIKYDEKYLLG